MSKMIGIIEQELRKILKINEFVLMMGKFLYYWVEELSLCWNLELYKHRVEVLFVQLTSSTHVVLVEYFTEDELFVGAVCSLQ